MFVHKNLDGILSTDQEPEDRNLVTVVLSLCFSVILLVSSRTEQGFVLGEEVHWIARAGNSGIRNIIYVPLIEF